MPFNPFSLIPWADAVKFGFTQYQQYLDKARILSAIEDYIEKTRKVDASYRRRLLVHFRKDDGLRKSLMSAVNEKELALALQYRGTKTISYEPLITDIVGIFIAQKLSQSGNFLQTQSNYKAERIEQKLDLVLLSLDEYTVYANRAMQRVKSDPLGASSDFAIETLKGKGIKAFSVKPDTGTYEVEYEPPRITVSGRGKAARQLKKMVGDIEADKAFHYVLESTDGYTLTAVEYGPEKIFDNVETWRLEFSSAPIVTQKQYNYNVGGHLYTVMTEVAFDRLKDTLTFRPITSDSSVSFTMVFDKSEGIFRFTASIRFQDNKPSTDSLPLLRFISQMEPGKDFSITDITLDLSACILKIPEPENNDFWDFVRYAKEATAYLDANNHLQLKGIISRDLPWPLTSEEYRDTFGLLKKIVAVVKEDRPTGYMSCSATFESLSEAGKGVRLIDRVAVESVFRSRAVISFNGEAYFIQEVSIAQPEVSLYKDANQIECGTIGEAFEIYGAPIKISFSHDEAVTRFVPLDESV